MVKKGYTCLRRQENLIFFILIIVFVAVVSGCGRKETSQENLTPALSSEEREKTPALSETATSSSEITETATSTAETAISTDEIDISDWKVYKNEEYGYLMKYPKNWEVAETDYYDKNFDWHVKNVTFQSANGEYSLIVGLARKDEDATFVPRTGFGATDIVKDKIVDFGNIKVEALDAFYKDVVGEIYYSKLNSNRDPYEYFEINNFLAHATFSYNKSPYVDLRETEELKIAEKILKSFKFYKE